MRGVIGVALSRRDFLAASVTSGAVLLSRPSGAAGARLGPSADTAAARTSKLDPSLRLVHADLHNHTLLSDGDGRAEDAFETMRSHGLDVAALTDHSGVGKVLGPTCQGCDAAIGIDESEWDRLEAYADAANTDGEFVALRGFEWSSPVLGHMNVWFCSTTSCASPTPLGLPTTAHSRTRRTAPRAGPSLTPAPSSSSRTTSR